MHVHLRQRRHQRPFRTLIALEQLGREAAIPVLRHPQLELPDPRISIAADGPAAEVFRVSPEEPWRVIRTRWRIGGVVKGVVEGGGRVSGYFTGATGTTVYRGDAYGEDFVNNTFTGDAGGQLVHRKKVYPDGVSLIGRRPDGKSQRSRAKDRYLT